MNIMISLWTPFWRFVLGGDRWVYLANAGHQKQLFYNHKQDILARDGFKDGWHRQVIDKECRNCGGEGCYQCNGEGYFTSEYYLQRYQLGNEIFFTPHHTREEVTGVQRYSIWGHVIPLDVPHESLPALSIVLFIWKPKILCLNIWRSRQRDLLRIRFKVEDQLNRARRFFKCDRFDEIPF